MNPRPRVIVLDDHERIARASGPWHRILDRVELDVVHERLQGEELVARLRSADVIVLMRERTRIPDDALEQLDRLQLVVTTGMGTAAIGHDVLRSRGIPLLGTRGRSGGTVELTWGLIISLLRGIPAAHERLASGGWEASVGVELEERTLGLIGLGRIGSRVAAVAAAFGMNVLAWSQNLTEEVAAASGCALVPLPELLDRSDVVSIHLKLSQRTEGLIDAAALERIGPAGFLINTSRGPIVDEAALVDALLRKGIAGAALDVYWEEPLPPDHPIRSLTNVVLSPHLGYVTDRNMRGYFDDVVADIEAWLAGDLIRRIT